MTFEGHLTLDGDERVALIASRFNHLITDRLIEGSEDGFVRHGGVLDHLDIVLVPGAFEIPLVLKKIASGDHNYQGFCCLGAIIKGATPHFDYISAEATKGISQIALQYNIPTSFGILTTDNIDQAIQRAGSKAGNKGFEAMTTLIEMINLLKKF